MEQASDMTNLFPDNEMSPVDKGKSPVGKGQTSRVSEPGPSCRHPHSSEAEATTSCNPSAPPKDDPSAPPEPPNEVQIDPHTPSHRFLYFFESETYVYFLIWIMQTIKEFRDSRVVIVGQVARQYHLDAGVIEMRFLGGAVGIKIHTFPVGGPLPPTVDDERIYRFALRRTSQTLGDLLPHSLPMLPLPLLILKAANDCRRTGPDDAELVWTLAQKLDRKHRWQDWQLYGLKDNLGKLVGADPGKAKKRTRDEWVEALRLEEQTGQ
ncbi:hypothetical protein BO94DRAFT_549255 [Aspergillus sclerotioniger CBS 115572]|uniref:Uncharacterized protein n=1 Tax=Aspergillus sclerotioniger CBS 115572 TaxID=1450535 RepID=A0A317VU41_9EURO|nr:hypothetical protein BO94DRAFT_549255 [Aspergillus sclerotioniger CBS 115572]PWY76472.1 hypothetical protein BO94DRAFT_549255 [Aspergillus sclerotioniger CBS 115572]